MSISYRKEWSELQFFLLVLLVYASTTRIQLKNSEIEKVGFPEQANEYSKKFNILNV